MSSLYPSSESVVKTTSSMAYWLRRSFGHENASNWSSTEFKKAFFSRSSTSKQIFLIRKKTKITLFDYIFLLRRASLLVDDLKRLKF